MSLPLMHDASRRLMIGATDIPYDDDRAWRLADIEQGVVQVDAILTETYLPNVLNYHLNGAVDFKKGCYRGQEIVARVFYRGQLKQRLAHLYCQQTDVTSIPYVFYRQESTAVVSQVNVDENWHGLVLLPADLQPETPIIDGSQQMHILNWHFCH